MEEIITNGKRKYVIKDSGGRFITPKQTKEGWYYLIYSGKASGFTFYNDSNGKQTAMKELKALNDLGNNFYLDYIDDVKSIPEGELIFEDDTYNLKNNFR